MQACEATKKELQFVHEYIENLYHEDWDLISDATYFLEFNIHHKREEFFRTDFQQKLSIYSIMDFEDFLSQKCPDLRARKIFHSPKNFCSVNWENDFLKITELLYKTADKPETLKRKERIRCAIQKLEDVMNRKSKYLTLT